MVLTEGHPETAGPLEKLARAAADEKLPPVDAWQPVVQKDMGLRISRDGAWHYLGSPIARPSLVRLLSRVMKREGEDFFLVSPVEKLRIEVEDAPFLAVELECAGESQSQRLVLFLCDGTRCVWLPGWFRIPVGPSVCCLSRGCALGEFCALTQVLLQFP